MTISEVASDDVGAGLVWIKKDAGKAFDVIQQMQDAKGGITGVPTGLVDLDRMTAVSKRVT